MKTRSIYDDERLAFERVMQSLEDLKVIGVKTNRTLKAQGHNLGEPFSSLANGKVHLQACANTLQIESASTSSWVATTCARPSYNCKQSHGVRVAHATQPAIPARCVLSRQ